jgi:hypothetical protein
VETNFSGSVNPIRAKWEPKAQNHAFPEHGLANPPLTNKFAIPTNNSYLSFSGIQALVLR